jgi:hypothetical protein
MEAGQPRHGRPSNGVERLRVATTCGSPLIVLISGRLPAELAGSAIWVGGAFRRRVRVVGAINSHLFAVDAAADRSVTNAVAVLVDDVGEGELRVARRLLPDEGEAAPRHPCGESRLPLHGEAS